MESKKMGILAVAKKICQPGRTAWTTYRDGEREDISRFSPRPRPLLPRGLPPPPLYLSFARPPVYPRAKKGEKEEKEKNADQCNGDPIIHLSTASAHLVMRCFVCVDAPVCHRGSPLPGLCHPHCQ